MGLKIEKNLYTTCFAFFRVFEFLLQCTVKCSSPTHTNPGALKIKNLCIIIISYLLYQQMLIHN